MRRTLVMLASACAVGGLLTGGQTATADDLTVLSCYGNAKPYSKLFDVRYAPPTFPGAWFTTTANCADINIKTTAQRRVKVCFLPSGGGVVCQPNWVYTVPNQWTVVATNVQDGTRFGFDFATGGANSGQYAA
ncbi:hypothetical protein L3Q67_33500 [Saccharothrix sp. AJ9571]|nr:hypothetical protein L3Q67_33500 [Saccharothrix sp. AJ9571]